MRFWTLHPKYLDSRGLVALWREALLARAVLRGRTRGYRHHPQLDRFRAHATPRMAINAYLEIVHLESARRGFCFDRGRFGTVRASGRIEVTIGQMRHEWAHLLSKLAARSPDDYERWKRVRTPDPHPLFQVVPGAVEHWEKGAP